MKHSNNQQWRYYKVHRSQTQEPPWCITGHSCHSCALQPNVLCTKSQVPSVIETHTMASLWGMSVMGAWWWRVWEEAWGVGNARFILYTCLSDGTKDSGVFKETLGKREVIRHRGSNCNEKLRPPLPAGLFDRLASNARQPREESLQTHTRAVNVAGSTADS